MENNEEHKEDKRTPTQEDTNKLLSTIWQADVLDQARLRPPNTVLRYNYDGKIVSLLLNLKSIGKADLTVGFVSDRLKYLAKYVSLDNPEEVNLFIARKQCLDSHKDGLVKAYNHYAQFYSIKYAKPRFRCEKKLPRIPTREYHGCDFSFVKEVCDYL